MYERCEFAQELVYVQGFQRETVGNWVCLAYFESAYNTAATNYNSNDSTDYGIFQINDNYWCDDDVGASNDCGMSCSSLLDDSITDDCDCAEIIYERHGFEAWYGWIDNCEGTDTEQWVADCF